MRIIAGSLKNRSIAAPKGLNTRPTSSKVRGALFNICQNYVADARFLDLFAGSGAMGIEALSRGASHAVFIDDNPASCRCIQSNLKALSIESRGEILCRDAVSALKWLQKKNMQFDIVYIDPPYQKFHVESLLTPFKESLLAPDGILFLEEGAGPLPNFPFSGFEQLSQREYGKTVLYQLKKEMIP